MSAEHVIEIARGELGYTESPPGSNRTKYWEEYDPAWQGQPWCVAFLWWVFRRAGEAPAFLDGTKTASCGILARWYGARGQTVPKENIAVGDIALLNFHGGTEPEHCGLVTAVLAHGWIQTIEGNTSPGAEGSQVSGGCVALKRRYVRQLAEVCRPKYKMDEREQKDYEGHWAEKAIRWAIKKELMIGRPDGTFRPDEPVTRAELALVLQRLEGEE